MERKTQLERLSTARKKKELFIAIAGAKRKTPSLTGRVEVETMPEEAERYWQIFPPSEAENVVPLAISRAARDSDYKRDPNADCTDFADDETDR